MWLPTFLLLLRVQLVLCVWKVHLKGYFEKGDALAIEIVPKDIPEGERVYIYLAARDEVDSTHSIAPVIFLEYNDKEDKYKLYDNTINFGSRDEVHIGDIQFGERWILHIVYLDTAMEEHFNFYANHMLIGKMTYAREPGIYSDVYIDENQAKVFTATVIKNNQKDYELTQGRIKAPEGYPWPSGNSNDSWLYFLGFPAGAAKYEIILGNRNDRSNVVLDLTFKINSGGKAGDFMIGMMDNKKKWVPVKKYGSFLDSNTLSEVALHNSDRGVMIYINPKPGYQKPFLVECESFFKGRAGFWSVGDSRVQLIYGGQMKPNINEALSLSPVIVSWDSKKKASAHGQATNTTTSPGSN